MSQSKYYTDESSRRIIDDFLRENAHIECHLGTDSTDDERRIAKEKQDKLFKKIKMIDEEFYKIVTGDRT
jgi:hypothetical protein